MSEERPVTVEHEEPRAPLMPDIVFDDDEPVALEATEPDADDDVEAHGMSGFN